MAFEDSAQLLAGSGRKVSFGVQEPIPRVQGTVEKHSPAQTIGIAGRNRLQRCQHPVSVFRQGKGPALDKFRYDFDSGNRAEGISPPFNSAFIVN